MSTTLGKIGFVLKGIYVRARFLLLLALVAALLVGWERMKEMWADYGGKLMGITPRDRGVSPDTEYYCPMCPGVMSDWPSKCPVCHMALVVRKRGGDMVLPSGVVARMQVTPYRLSLGAIATAAAESRSIDGKSRLVVPATAVIDTGKGALVYVDRGHGTFDAVPIQIDIERDNMTVVVSGLKVGDRVATAGALLLDAETKLNPSLAAAYFGANRPSSANGSFAESAKVDANAAEIVAALGQLSDADRKQAERQKICPVTSLPLGSMGKPPTVEVSGRRVFICCDGCKAALLKDPAKHLAKLSPAANP